MRWARFLWSPPTKAEPGPPLGRRCGRRACGAGALCAHGGHESTPERRVVRLGQRLFPHPLEGVRQQADADAGPGEGKATADPVLDLCRVPCGQALDENGSSPSRTVRRMRWPVTRCSSSTNGSAAARRPWPRGAGEATSGSCRPTMKSPLPRRSRAPARTWATSGAWVTGRATTARPAPRRRRWHGTP